MLLAILAFFVSLSPPITHSLPLHPTPREREAMLKGEFSEKGGKVLADMKRKKTLKRIKEYERLGLLVLGILLKETKPDW